MAKQKHLFLERLVSGTAFTLSDMRAKAAMLTLAVAIAAAGYVITTPPAYACGGGGADVSVDVDVDVDVWVDVWVN